MGTTKIQRNGRISWLKEMLVLLYKLAWFLQILGKSELLLHQLQIHKGSNFKEQGKRITAVGRQSAKVVWGNVLGRLDNCYTPLAKQRQRTHPLQEEAPEALCWCRQTPLGKILWLKNTEIIFSLIKRDIQSPSYSSVVRSFHIVLAIKLFFVVFFDFISCSL